MMSQIYTPFQLCTPRCSWDELLAPGSLLIPLSHCRVLRSIGAFVAPGIGNYCLDRIRGMQKITFRQCLLRPFHHP